MKASDILYRGEAKGFEHAVALAAQAIRSQLGRLDETAPYFETVRGLLNSDLDRANKAYALWQEHKRVFVDVLRGHGLNDWAEALLTDDYTGMAI